VSILTVLIPISLVLLVVAIAGFLWAVRSGQFDDLDSPAWRILADDDKASEADDESDRSGDSR